MTITVDDIQNFLKSLAKDHYLEDVINEGSPAQPVRSVVVCWFANRGVRRTVERVGADLVIMHEKHLHAQAHRDAGCPAADDWPINREARAFYRDRNVAVIRSHRTLDAYCIRDFADALGLPPPVVHTGRMGYEYTLVYEIAPTPLRELAAGLKSRLGLPQVRISADGDPNQPICRLGNGWGGVSLSANLQYIELLREQGVEAIIGGEIDEYALEYYRDVGLRWIELGHYVSEIIGLRRVARDLAARFPSLQVTCHEDAGPRVAFV